MMMHQARSGHHPAQQQGLSLLELLLVVVILSAASLLALELYGNNDNQLRFEQTRQRLQQIRHAIIGNPQQNRSGFVQDMGRLPVNLRELVQPPISCDGGAVPDDDMNNDGVPDDCEWAFDTDSGLWAGWRGPYLDTLPGINGALSFRDAWGNTNPGAPENFGWRFETNANGDVFVQSRGLDQQANPADAATFAALNDYERDYPPSADALDVQGLPSPLIRSVEYQLDISNGQLQVDLGYLPPCWRCAGAIGNSRTECGNNGGIWQPISTAIDEASCIAAVAIWQPTDGAKLVFFQRENGQVNSDLLPGAVTVNVNYKGTNERVLVDLPNDFTAQSASLSYAVVWDADNNGTFDNDEYLAASPVGAQLIQIGRQGPLPLLHWSVF